MAGETIIGWTYGLEIQPKNDYYVETALKGVRPLFEAAIPGAFLVDVAPFLKKVPGRMPFAGFKRKARQWRKLALEMVNIPYEAAKPIASCILGLLENPMVIKKAQEELDRVLNPNQLPTFADEDSLPYITAITEETLRWRDVAPIGTNSDLNLRSFRDSV
ncbi:hypothetical protein C0993_002333 [Termitomyces sp. T159_Od127]|nr:hypothetical protein C0993_002333 [Termitomyces sp. T159_Od127]